MSKRRLAAGFFNADRVAALVFLGAVGFYGWESRQFTAALQEDVVGPAFFPKILAVVGLILAVLLFVEHSPDEDAGSETAESPGAHITALAPVLIMLAYVLVLEPLGFPLATVIFLTITFRYLGFPRWKGALLLAVAVTGAIFGLFYLLLDLRLPLGILAGLA